MAESGNVLGPFWEAMNMLGRCWVVWGRGGKIGGLLGMLDRIETCLGVCRHSLKTGNVLTAHVISIFQWMSCNFLSFC